MGFLDLFRRNKPPKRAEPTAVHIHNNNRNLAITILTPNSAPQIMPPLTNGFQKLSHFLDEDGQLHIAIGEVIATDDTLGEHVQKLRADIRKRELDEHRETVLRLPNPIK